MKRIANPISTTELCSYGCGQIAKFMNGSGRVMCCERHNSCPANRRKNSSGLKNAYKTELRLSGSENYQASPQVSKDNMSWNRGKRFAEFGYGGKGQHKNALIAERGHKCECCGLSEWMEKPITLELEHIDADKKNNTRENLKLLCPNCHSQTPTWRRGNKPGWKTKRYSDSVLVETIKTSTSLNQVLDKLDLRYGSAKTVVDIMGKYQVNFMVDK